MGKYRLVALRSIVAICEKYGECFIGNHDIKIFKTKKEVQEFLKSENFKELDKLIPMEWHIEKFEVE